MLSLKELLPPAKSAATEVSDFSYDPWVQGSVLAWIVTGGLCSTYVKQAGFIPRKPEEFGDGGAFPEIHVAQYPLDMDWRERKPDAKTLPANVDAQGNVAYDAIVKQKENASKIVYSQHKDLLPKLPGEGRDQGAVANEEQENELIEKTTKKTKEALEKFVKCAVECCTAEECLCPILRTHLHQTQAITTISSVQFWCQGTNYPNGRHASGSSGATKVQA